MEGNVISTFISYYKQCIINFKSNIINKPINHTFMKLFDIEYKKQYVIKHIHKCYFNMLNIIDVNVIDHVNNDISKPIQNFIIIINIIYANFNKYNCKTNIDNKLFEKYKKYILDNNNNKLTFSNNYKYCYDKLCDPSKIIIHNLAITYDNMINIIDGCLNYLDDNFNNNINNENINEITDIGNSIYGQICKYNLKQTKKFELDKQIEELLNAREKYVKNYNKTNITNLN